MFEGILSVSVRKLRRNFALSVHLPLAVMFLSLDMPPPNVTLKRDREENYGVRAGVLSNSRLIAGSSGRSRVGGSRRRGAVRTRG